MQVLPYLSDISRIILHLNLYSVLCNSVFIQRLRSIQLHRLRYEYNIDVAGWVLLHYGILLLDTFTGYFYWILLLDTFTGYFYWVLLLGTSSSSSSSSLRPLTSSVHCQGLRKIE